MRIGAKQILALDAALGGCSAAVVSGATVLAERHAEGSRGQAALLPDMLRDVLTKAGLPATALDAIGVTVGPGSFTGLRAALALAHGLALAIGCPVVAVTVAEAMAAEAMAAEAMAGTWPVGHGRTIWTAIDNRRGRVFLDTGCGMRATDLARLPPASGPIAVTGDAAVAVADQLSARGADVLLTEQRLPRARWVAIVAATRLAGRLPPLDAQPLYVDPPEAKLPAAGLRPPPSLAAAIDVSDTLRITLLP